MSISALFLAASIQFSLPQGLLDSICWVETKHDVSAIHYQDGSSNSIGICQIKWNTAKDLGFKGTEQQLLNPKTNIFYAAKYLQYQFLRYNGDIEKTIVAYNQGSVKLLTQTAYSRRVIQHWREETHERYIIVDRRHQE